MINNLVSSLLQFVFKFLASFVNLITNPIYNFLEDNFPQVNSFINTSILFLNREVLPGIAFAREVFFNVTGFPRDLMTIGVGLVIALVGASALLSVIVFVVNIYKFYRNGES